MPKKKKFSVRIRWGTEQTRADSPGATVSKYSFDTEKELNAFLLGVDEGAGWLEYEIVED